MHVLGPPTEGPYAGDIVFFHGLQLGRDYTAAWENTWTAGAGGPCWPVDFLAEQLRQAGQPVRVMSVAYDSRALGRRCTPEGLAESLYTSLVLTEDVGKLRPIILIGHSLGGLIIKQVCILAHRRAMRQDSEAHSDAERSDRQAARTFLKRLRLVAFLATPHAGSRAADWLRGQWLLSGSPVLDVLTTISKQSATLHAEFSKLSKEFRWSLQAFGERERFLKASLDALHIPGQGLCKHQCSC